MINYENICSRIQAARGCSRDTAWDAIASAYLSMDKSIAVTDAQQAAYIYKAACMRAINVFTAGRVVDEAQRAMDFLRNKLAGANPDDRDLSDDDLFVAQQDPQTIAQYLRELVADLPVDYKIAVLVVVHALLEPNDRQRKPLSVEMTRQYLKRAKIKNTSEYARQVYTFLTTLKRRNG